MSFPYTHNSDSDRIGWGNYPHHFHPYVFLFFFIVAVMEKIVCYLYTIVDRNNCRVAITLFRVVRGIGAIYR
jgi:hypothetical protein